MSRLNMLRCSVAVVGLAVAAAAFGAEPATTPVTPATPGIAATAPDGLACRKRLRAGSHIAKRICMTPAQWTAFLTARRHSRGLARLPEYAHGGWGNVSTAGASVGMSAFTPQR